HELRTPLSVINGFAEILVREKLGPLNDEQKRRVRKILLQGQRLNHIIDELLDLSRIRSGKIEVRCDVFDLIPVLKASLDDHHVLCEQQKLELVDSLPDVLPDVIGDLDRVTQVVVNLLNNAIKYTEPGGRIEISARYDRQKDQVRVEVKDTGIGVDPEDQPRLFQEFYRASAKHHKKFTGSGLGLAIVKQLIESQHGEVGVISEGLGMGSCFYFTLPAAKNQKKQVS
ncbi:MAG: HAMP domain-containing histidine kinase, partial [Candidatus Omnitrophica bacterium]|nr:HAMP domain-containing histidine kinase [Candidatus Omnitrophota bacterium]